jgi:hypothetical protein
MDLLFSFIKGDPLQIIYTLRLYPLIHHSNYTKYYYIHYGYQYLRLVSVYNEVRRDLRFIIALRKGHDVACCQTLVAFVSG